MSEQKPVTQVPDGHTRFYTTRQKARTLYFGESFATVEWSPAWPGRGIELDSSALVIDFIG